MIWKWPTLRNGWDEPLFSALLGIAAGSLLVLAGMADFARRDVK
jgi:hypothetical protein